MRLPILDRLDAMTDGLQYEFNPVTITRIGVASVYSDRLNQCRDAYERVVRDGREGGAIALAIQARLQMCLGDWQTGRWDEALELADEGNALCEEHGYRRYYLHSGRLHQGARVGGSRRQGDRERPPQVT